MKFSILATLVASTQAYSNTELFLIGFTESVLSEENMTDYEKCVVEEPTEALAAIQQAIADLKNLSITETLAALVEIYKATELISYAYETCTQTQEGDQFKRILAILESFSNPLNLVWDITGNLKINGWNIAKELDAADQAWIKEDYSEFGKQTGLLVADSVFGKPTATRPEGFNFKPTAQFLGGLFDGLIQDNHLTAINHCVHDVEAVGAGVKNTIDDFKQKDFSHILAGITQLGQTLEQVTKDVQECEQVPSDIKRVQSWVTSALSNKDFVNTAIRNILLAGPKVQADIDALQSDANAKNHAGCGEDAAAILVTALGAIPESPEMVKSYLF